MAQSATLDFSPAAWAVAGKHRSGTSARNPATLRQLACWIRQIRECGSLVALESRTCARFEAASFGAEARARSRLRRWIFLVHIKRARSFRAWPRRGAGISFYRVARAFRCSARRLEDRSVQAVARSGSKVRLDHRVLGQF